MPSLRTLTPPTDLKHTPISFTSNSGGRQVDGAIPALYALEQIMKSEKIRSAQRCGVLTVLFDSGIRTGSDIIKAIALGAQAVLRKSSVQGCIAHVRRLQLY